MSDFKNISVKLLESGILLQWEASSYSGLLSIYASTEAVTLPEEKNQIACAPVIDGQYMWKQAEKEKHYYFWLVTEMGMSVQVAQRMLPTEGIVNFRDLGGYPTKDGRYTCWGRLFRSGAHDGVTENDISLLKQLHIKTVVDYRSVDEKGKCPDIKIEGIHYLELPVFADAGVTDVLNLDGIQSAADAKAMFQEMNRTLVHDAQAHRVYAAMLRTCLNPEQVPMVQHCTAGKDRVGVGVATILLLLGVPEDIVLDDYLLSNTSRVSIQKLEHVSGNATNSTQQEIFSALTMVQTEYLCAFMEEMKAVYGTIENYAIDALGITTKEITQLREIYLTNRSF